MGRSPDHSRAHFDAQPTTVEIYTHPPWRVLCGGGVGQGLPPGGNHHGDDRPRPPRTQHPQMAPCDAVAQRAAGCTPPRPQGPPPAASGQPARCRCRGRRRLEHPTVAICGHRGAAIPALGVSSGAATLLPTRGGAAGGQNHQTEPPPTAASLHAAFPARRMQRPWGWWSSMKRCAVERAPRERGRSHRNIHGRSQAAHCWCLPLHLLAGGGKGACVWGGGGERGGDRRLPASSGGASRPGGRDPPTAVGGMLPSGR